MVSLENPLEAGDWTSKTSGPDPSADFVASHRGQDGGDLVGVALVDVGHEAALYRRWGDQRVSPGVGVRSGRIASPRVLIVIDLAEGRVYLNDPADFTRFSVALEGEGDLAEVVRQSGLGRLRDDGEHVVVDPVALRGAGGASRRRGLGRGLFRHVRVRRREGVDGGRRGGRPHRATRRGGLRESPGRAVGQSCPIGAGRS